MRKMMIMLILITFVLNIFPVVRAENIQNNIEKWNIKNFEISGNTVFDHKARKMYFKGGFYYDPLRMTDKIIITVKDITNRPKDISVDRYSITIEYYGKNPYGDYEKLITENLIWQDWIWSIPNKYMKNFANKRLEIDLDKYRSVFPPNNMPVDPDFDVITLSALWDWYEKQLPEDVNLDDFEKDYDHNDAVKTMRFRFLDWYFDQKTGGGRLTLMLEKLNLKYDLIRFVISKETEDDLVSSPYWRLFNDYSKPEYFYFDEIRFLDLYLKKPEEFITPELLYFYLVTGYHISEAYSDYTVYQWNPDYIVPVDIQRDDDYEAFDDFKIAKLYMDLNARNKSVLKYKDFIVRKTGRIDDKYALVLCKRDVYQPIKNFTSPYDPWLRLDMWTDIVGNVTTKITKYPGWVDPSLAKYLLYHEVDKTKDIRKAIYNVVYNYDNLALPYIKSFQNYTKLWLSVTDRVKQNLRALKMYPQNSYPDSVNYSPLTGLFLILTDTELYNRLVNFMQYPLKDPKLKEWMMEIEPGEYYLIYKQYNALMWSRAFNPFPVRVKPSETIKIEQKEKDSTKYIVIEEHGELDEKLKKERIEEDLMELILDAYKCYQNQPQTIEKLAYYGGLFMPLWFMKGPETLYFTGKKEEVDRQVETISGIYNILQNNIGFQMFRGNVENADGTEEENTYAFTLFLNRILTNGPKAEAQLKQKYKTTIPQIIQKYYPKQYPQYKALSALFVDFVLNSQYYKEVCKKVGKKPVNYKEVLNKIFPPAKTSNASVKKSTAQKSSTTGTKRTTAGSRKTKTLVKK